MCQSRIKMRMNIILDKLYELTNVFINKNLDLSNHRIARKVLHIILSESIQATNFVILIEDEFEIEFEDEEIDMDFFLSIERIARLVQYHLLKKNELV